MGERDVDQKCFRNLSVFSGAQSIGVGVRSDCSWTRRHAKGSVKPPLLECREGFWAPMEGLEAPDRERGGQAGALPGRGLPELLPNGKGHHPLLPHV